MDIRNVGATGQGNVHGYGEPIKNASSDLRKIEMAKTEKAGTEKLNLPREVQGGSATKALVSLIENSSKKSAVLQGYFHEDLSNLKHEDMAAHLTTINHLKNCFREWGDQRIK